MKFKKTGPRTEGQHYLQPIQDVAITTEYQAKSELPNGCYLEMCECHPLPERPFKQSTPVRVTVVKIKDGDLYSGEVEFHGFI